MIYLDNAATTLRKPSCVRDAVLQAMEMAGNPGRGAHGDALSASRAVYEARCRLAAFFGCRRPDHVVFTCNATEALNMAIHGLFSAGDHVITTDLEHNSVLRPLYRLEDAGVITLDFVPADGQGRLDCDALPSLIRPNTKAIICTHASNLTGNLVDVARIGAIAKANGLLLVVDASQTAGVVPINMEEMGIDVLCFTGHKSMLGPQGTGGLCIREGVEIRPFKLGGTGVHSYDRSQPHAYPTRLEAGTLNVHGIAGLSAAVGYLNEVGVDTVHRRELALMRRFLDGIAAIPGVVCYGDFDSPRTAVVALNLGAEDSAAVADALWEDYGIAVRPGAHCAPRMHRALGTVEQGAVRFSFGWCNTEEEVDMAIRAVRELAE